jgi:Transposase zinc-binding domain
VSPSARVKCISSQSVMSQTRPRLLLAVSSQALTEDGETPPFLVTQLQPSTAQLSLEHPVLLAQEFDHVPLLLFEPSEQRRDKEMQRNHCASLRHCLVDPVLRHYGLFGCGVLAGGFARFRRAGCGCDRLVPFSCKGRAVCPSCGGRRTAERAAHLVDDVFPIVPVRRWVFSLPHRLTDSAPRGRLCQLFTVGVRRCAQEFTIRPGALRRCSCAWHEWRVYSWPRQPQGRAQKWSLHR